MKIRKNIKLRSFKLLNLLDEEKDNKNKKNILFQNITNNKVCKPKIYGYQKKNIFDSNSTEIHNNYLLNKTYFNKNRNRNKMYIINNNNNFNKALLHLNKRNKIDLFRTFDNSNLRTKCFSVPQTLNYYGKNDMKIKAAKAIMKMNNLLLKKNINKLSLPKNPSLYNSTNSNKNKFSPINNRKIMNMKKMNYFLNDKKYKNFFLFNSNDSKKKKLSLYEKEKMREKNRYNQILMEKFIELEACEKKFDIVIENTLQKLNNEEFNLYKK